MVAQAGTQKGVGIGLEIGNFPEAEAFVIGPVPGHIAEGGEGHLRNGPTLAERVDPIDHPGCQPVPGMARINRDQI